MFVSPMLNPQAGGPVDNFWSCPLTLWPVWHGRFYQMPLHPSASKALRLFVIHKLPHHTKVAVQEKEGFCEEIYLTFMTRSPRCQCLVTFVSCGSLIRWLLFFLFVFETKKKKKRRLLRERLLNNYLEPIIVLNAFFCLFFFISVFSSGSDLL